MNRSRTVAAMLWKYGVPVALGETRTRAVIRPLRTSSGAERDLTGGNSGLFYRYTGPAECPLAAGNTVEAENRTYTVRRAGTAELGGDALYVWAVLRELSDLADEEIELLFANGDVFAHAKGYEAKTLCSGRELRTWGEGIPAEIEEGQTSYQLSLYDVTPENEGESSEWGEFLIRIRGKSGKLVYSGCRVKEEKRTGGILAEPRYTLLVLAEGRTEESQ